MKEASVYDRLHALQPVGPGRQSAPEAAERAFGSHRRLAAVWGRLRWQQGTGLETRLEDVFRPLLRRVRPEGDT